MFGVQEYQRNGVPGLIARAARPVKPGTRLKPSQKIDGDIRQPLFATSTYSWGLETRLQLRVRDRATAQGHGCARTIASERRDMRPQDNKQLEGEENLEMATANDKIDYPISPFDYAAEQ